MAKSNIQKIESAVKKGKRVYKKVKKSKHKGLIVVLLLILIVIVGVFGFFYYSENASYNAFVEESNSFLDSLDIDSSVNSDINFETSDDFDVKYSVSDTKYVSETGKVSRPTYKEGDKKVTITVSIDYSGKTFLYSFLSSNFSSITKTYNVTIKAKDPTDEDIIEEIYSGINVPSSTFTSINLPNKVMYDDSNITWISDNTSILDNNGTVYTPTSDTLVTLTAQVTYKTKTINQNYEVLVLSKDFVVDEINDDFNALDETSRYLTITSNNITYYNALVIQEEGFDSSTLDQTDTNGGSNNLKLRSQKDNNAYFETATIAKANSLSFKYKFASDQKTEKTTLDFYINDILLKQETVLHNDWYTLTLDLSGYSDFVVKVVHNDTFSSDVMLLIDDVKLERSLNQEDLTNSINMVSTTSKSIALPFTTSFGGSITWESSDTSILSNNGELLNKEDANTITLKAKVSYNDISFTLTYEIKIKGLTQSDPLQIYFIDLGETGLSDTGESIYIKYNDIDILVDAGDDFESTTNGVKNTINAYSEDLVLDYVIATHPDSDHIGNMANVFKEYQVNELIKFSGESFTTQKFKNLKAAYDSEPNCTVYDIYNDIFNGSVSKYIYLTDDIYIEFIDTHNFLSDESNGRSIVFLLHVYDTKVLFTGDADNQGSHSTMETGYMDQVGDIDILKVVHHGTAKGCDLTYLNYIKPEVAVVCNGNYLGNKHGHPHVQAISNLLSYKSDIKIYAITGGGLNASMTSTGAYKGDTTLEESKADRNGTITLTIDNNGYTFTSKNYGSDILPLTETTYWKNYKALN